MKVTYRFTEGFDKGAGFVLEMQLLGYDGTRENVSYELFQLIDDEPKLVLSGEEYSPSPMCNWNSKSSAISLLGFLSCGEDDVDEDYFKDYTAEQMEWVRSIHREDLSCLVCDLEEE